MVVHLPVSGRSGKGLFAVQVPGVEPGCGGDFDSVESGEPRGALAADESAGAEEGTLGLAGAEQGGDGGPGRFGIGLDGSDEGAASTVVDFPQPWPPVRRYSTCSSDGPIMVTHPIDPPTPRADSTSSSHLGRLYRHGVTIPWSSQIKIMINEGKPRALGRPGRCCGSGSGVVCHRDVSGVCHWMSVVLP